ncbi:MAG: hypothetical protein IH940_12025 [Acidobacteria bacterium]|nr:hypothetical protein [Acidobacteriota bacterium]
MISLDVTTVLVQWAMGALFFTWVTTRRREVGLGYGWLQRGVFGAMLAGSLVTAAYVDVVLVREMATLCAIGAVCVAQASSIHRRKAGVSGQREGEQRRSARVAEMTGIDREVATLESDVAEFDPRLDLIAPVIGVVGLVAAGIDAGDPMLLSVARVLSGAALLGVLSDAMLLGHWYLVQPGLARSPLLELVRAAMVVWPFELIVLLWPIGMFSVLNGSIDDGYNGLLGWFWAGCAVGTIALLLVTRAALREREYSAVMAATGLLYLAILAGFGMDLVARATLA